MQNNRLQKLNDALAAERLDAVFLTKQANQRYLEGFTGADCYMIAGPFGNFLIADSRYVEAAQKECRTAEVRPHRFPSPPLGEVIAGIASEKKFKRIGFEDGISWKEHEQIEKALGRAGAEFVPTSLLVETIRAVKSPEEAAMIAAACQIADRALKDLLPSIKPGVSELDLKTELDYKLKTGGAEDAAFDTMVLFGARSSQNHATSQGDVSLKEGDLILIDYGAVKRGYRSDTTRTFVCGRAAPEQRRAYDAVLKSQMETISMIAPGVNGRELNSKALSIIADAGLPGFHYSIGHGVGLEIHELPAMRQNADAILEPNMVLTVEPGTYTPGWGGIRIEDTLIVTETGCDTLTFFPKELIEL